MKKMQKILIILYFLCFLNYTKFVTFAEEASIYFVSERHMVYQEADVNSDIIGEISQNTSVYVLEYDNDFLKIFINGNIGYIKSDDATKEDTSVVLSNGYISPEDKKILEKNNSLSNTSEISTNKTIVFGVAFGIVFLIAITTYIKNKRGSINE